MAFKWTIQPSGEVTDVCVWESTLPDDAQSLLDCVGAVIASLRFEAGSSGFTTVVYPYAVKYGDKQP